MRKISKKHDVTGQIFKELRPCLASTKLVDVADSDVYICAVTWFEVGCNGPREVDASVWVN